MENDLNQELIYNKALKLRSEGDINTKEDYYKTSSKIINNLLVKCFSQDYKNNISIENNSINENKEEKSDIISKQELFSNRTFYTKKELAKKANKIFQRKKRENVKNFNENHIILSNQNNKIENNFFTLKNYEENSVQNKKKYIEYEDLFFEDDMFLPMSSSFPNEKEEDFLNKLQFIEDNNYNEDLEANLIRYCSISYKNKKREQIYSKYFGNSTKELSNKKLPEFDYVYKEEQDKLEENIYYIDNNKLINNMNIVTEKNSNKNNNLISKEFCAQTISYISLNLLIKKITLENFRNKYSIVYKCFLEQFKYFISINNLLNKIFSAFNYYNEKRKEDCSELLLFLNTLIYENYDLIKDDKTTLNQLKEFYIKIKVLNWENQTIIKDLQSLDYLLFQFPNIAIKEGFKDLINKIEIPKTKNIQKCDLDKYKTKSFDHSKKQRYFYVFNHKQEEIAQYLTCESYQLLSDIPESELYNKNFARKDKDIKAPHIKKIFDRYEKLTYFIIEDICSYDHISERIDAIEKWLKIALVCQELKNFNDLIMLNILFCHYLLKKMMKKTWAKLSKKTLNYIEKINKFCSGNQCYKKIRKEILKCKGPYIPYIGILLKELTYIEEKKYIIENNNINITKLTELYSTINKFFEFRRSKYPFDKSKNLEVLSNINPKSVDEIECIIKKLEPKLEIHAEKGDKKRLTKTDILFYS